MSSQDFTASILVVQTPIEVFDAINNVRGWWSGEIDGKTDTIGSEFIYRYKDVHRSTQKITELVPGKKIVWEVTDAYLSFVPDKDEWKGTRIIFEINKKGDKTEVRFTHFGLTPKFVCYGDCSNAWATLINDNLRNLIVSGKSQGDVFSQKES
ncbi:MAG TPA: SRPBCC domain-containing protein [Candidatus Saccharimonadales bacterium]|nr:SRPBCC domain-containing protein [Candidatus Saccharimonadales bacterium]